MTAMADGGGAAAQPAAVARAQITRYCHRNLTRRTYPRRISNQVAYRTTALPKSASPAMETLGIAGLCVTEHHCIC